MNVYTVIWSVPFEGSDLIGVFSTPEIANALKDKRNAVLEAMFPHSDTSFYHVEEWEVQTEVPKE